MTKYNPNLRSEIQQLRSQGKTYGEINTALHLKLAKSTLHWICRNTPLPQEYLDKITHLNIQNLGLARATALAVNKAKKEEYSYYLKKINTPIAQAVNNINTAKIALAMLCLGEASKSIHKHTFSLGSSDPRIVVIFIKLLKRCFSIRLEKIRCTVQCRADQNIKQLQDYWETVTGLPPSQFYKPLIDPRTVGKPTKYLDYKGVLNVYYADRKIQLELESLAHLIYNQLHPGPVVYR